jgi:hypothetical protein
MPRGDDLVCVEASVAVLGDDLGGDGFGGLGRNTVDGEISESQPRTRIERDSRKRVAVGVSGDGPAECPAMQFRSVRAEVLRENDPLGIVEIEARAPVGVASVDSPVDDLSRRDLRRRYELLGHQSRSNSVGTRRNLFDAKRKSRKQLHISRLIVIAAGRVLKMRACRLRPAMASRSAFAPISTINSAVAAVRALSSTW